MQRALEAAPPSAAAGVRVVDGRRLDLRRRTTPDAHRRRRHAHADSPRPGAAWLAISREGGRVWLSLGPDVDVPTLVDVLGVPVRLAPEPVEAAGDEAALVPADRRHPMLRRLAGSASALSRLPIERYRRVLDEQGWDVLARFAGGSVALAEREVGTGTLVLFTSDLDNRWNRFPLEPSFAPFVVETARYLTGANRSRVGLHRCPMCPTGYPPSPGAHTLTTGAAPRTVVVNVNPAESDPAPMTAEAFLARVPRTGEGAGARRCGRGPRAGRAQRLWQIGLLVMLAVLVGGERARTRAGAGPATQGRIGHGGSHGRRPPRRSAAFLDDIARRRAALAWRRAWTLGATVAAAVLAGHRRRSPWVAAPGRLLLVAAVGLGSCRGRRGRSASRWRRRADGPRRSSSRDSSKSAHGGLDDVVVTAVDYAVAARPRTGDGRTARPLGGRRGVGRSAPTSSSIAAEVRYAAAARRWQRRPLLLAWRRRSSCGR